MARLQASQDDVTGNLEAMRLFAPIASNYDRWSALLSLGQDPRWRRYVVDQLDLPAGSRVLDVAAGTGLIGRLLEARGHQVVALDLSREMLERADRAATRGVLAAAEALPFPAMTFDGLTFGYLLRYVKDPLGTMRELTRVLRRDGKIGMVEFGRPRGIWGPPWWLYTRVGLPAAGLVAGRGWIRVGSFLGPSIDRFQQRFPPDALAAVWREAGLTDVHVVRRSLGGGLVMWARRR
jgi:demethylmenaquinone methyltransferase / 2-methoxy-6-polyprenyl-1,4-benzoquinol methylase